MLLGSNLLRHPGEPQSTSISGQVVAWCSGLDCLVCAIFARQRPRLIDVCITLGLREMKKKKKANGVTV